jgi:hypothetical protein
VLEILSTHRYRAAVQALALTLLVLLPLSATSYADELENQLKDAISQLKANQGAKSPETARINSAAVSKVNRIESALTVPTPLPADPAREVLSHVTSAQASEPFPKPEDVVLPPENREFNPPIASSPYQEPKRSGEPPPLPPRCTKEGTVKLPRDEAEKQEEVRIDRLYIPAKFVPPEADEVYGSKVQVYGYDKENPSREVRVAAESDGIPCVPFRFRITNRYEYLDYGKAAFKNYDQHYQKRNVLPTTHPWVLERLSSLR